MISSSRLVEYTPPPSSVPGALSGATSLRPAQYSWRIDGTMREEGPSSDADVTVNEVRTDRGAGLPIRLSTSVDPLVARVMLYDDVGPDGVPSREQARVVDCHASPDCSVEPSADGGSIDVDYVGDMAGVEYAVLYVEYATEEGADTADGIAAYRASWVLRVLAR
jgi:hypothetical protein